MVWCKLKPMTCFRSVCKILTPAVRKGREQREITKHHLCSLIMITALENPVFLVYASSNGWITIPYDLNLSVSLSYTGGPSTFSHKDLLYHRGISFSWDLSPIRFLFSYLPVGGEHEDHIFEWEEHSAWILGKF